jgi:hypothetical protein
LWKQATELLVVYTRVRNLTLFLLNKFMSEKKLEIVFAPGCFDDFEGSQEELDNLVEQIRTMAANGELFENSTPIDELIDALPEDEFQKLSDALVSLDTETNPRRLQ